MQKIQRINDAIFRITLGNPLNPIDIVNTTDVECKCDFRVVENKSLFSILSNGEELAKEIGFSIENGKTSVRLISSGAHFFGFGEKMGFLDKRGVHMKMVNTDNPLHTPDLDPMYISLPFFIAVSPWKPAMGFYLNSTAFSFFDMDGDTYSFGAQDNGIEFYIIYGPSVSDVVKRFTSMVGRMPMPPAWAIGYQQSRWSYATADQALKIARKMREDGIPCDVIYLDIDYMDGYRVFTWGDGFTNPKSFVNKLKSMGFKVVTIVDPGVKKENGYDVFETGKKIKAFCKSEDEEDFVGYVWPGRCVFPDFLRADVREWWARQHKVLFDAGVDGIWNDMNEPSVVWTDKKTEEVKALLNENEVSFALLDRMKGAFVQKDYGDEIIHTDDHGEKWPHSKVRNVYALLESIATLKAFEIYKPGKRHFVLSRAGFAGIQKYSAVWTGDNSSWWEHLESEMSTSMGLGLSGVCFTGSDVGGFGGNATPELLIRWTEMGAFLPFFRNHTAIGTDSQEPWAFGEEVEKIVKRYIKLRYELFPYMYTCFYDAHKTGIPIMRPLLMYDQDDLNLYSVNDEFMVGDSILVAPVVRPNTTWRSVYLPQGKWIDMRDMRIYKGKHVYKIMAPLDEIPVFVKENSMIFRTDPMNYIFDRESLTLYGDLYGQKAFAKVYEDDGETLEYNDGKYNLYEISVETNSDGYSVNFKALKHDYSGRYKKFTLSFMSWENMNLPVVKVNGKVMKSYFAQGTPRINFDLKEWSSSTKSTDER